MRKIVICAFCHVRIDGTVYSRRKRQMHRVCWEIDGERKTPQIAKISATGPFRMLSFSGQPGLKLRVA